MDTLCVEIVIVAHHVSIQKTHAGIIERGYGIKGSNPPVKQLDFDLQVGLSRTMD